LLSRGVAAVATGAAAAALVAVREGIEQQLGFL
jgi:hypothetical protein